MPTSQHYCFVGHVYRTIMYLYITYIVLKSKSKLKNYFYVNKMSSNSLFWLLIFLARSPTGDCHVATSVPQMVSFGWLAHTEGQWRSLIAQRLSQSWLNPSINIFLSIIRCKVWVNPYLIIHVFTKKTCIKNGLGSAIHNSQQLGAAEVPVGCWKDKSLYSHKGILHTNGNRCQKTIFKNVSEFHQYIWVEEPGTRVTRYISPFIWRLIIGETHTPS